MKAMLPTLLMLCLSLLRAAGDDCKSLLEYQKPSTEPAKPCEVSYYFAPVQFYQMCYHIGQDRKNSYRKCNPQDYNHICGEDKCDLVLQASTLEDRTLKDQNDKCTNKTVKPDPRWYFFLPSNDVREYSLFPEIKIQKVHESGNTCGKLDFYLSEQDGQSYPYQVLKPFFSKDLVGYARTRGESLTKVGGWRFAYVYVVPNKSYRTEPWPAQCMMMRNRQGDYVEVCGPPATLTTYFKWRLTFIVYVERYKAEGSDNVECNDHYSHCNGTLKNVPQMLADAKALAMKAPGAGSSSNAPIQPVLLTDLIKNHYINVTRQRPGQNTHIIDHPEHSPNTVPSNCSITYYFGILGTTMFCEKTFEKTGTSLTLCTQKQLQAVCSADQPSRVRKQGCTYAWKAILTKERAKQNSERYSYTSPSGFTDTWLTNRHPYSRTTQDIKKKTHVKKLKDDSRFCGMLDLKLFNNENQKCLSNMKGFEMKNVVNLANLENIGTWHYLTTDVPVDCLRHIPPNKRDIVEGKIYVRLHYLLFVGKYSGSTNGGVTFRYCANNDMYSCDEEEGNKTKLIEGAKAKVDYLKLDLTLKT